MRAWWKEGVPVREIEKRAKAFGLSRRQANIVMANKVAFPDRRSNLPKLITVAAKSSSSVRDDIIRLVHEGKSNSAISRELGLTRGQVCGLVWRLGLAGERPQNQIKSGKKQGKATKAKRKPKAPPKPKPPALVTIPAPREPEPTPVALNITFDQINAGMCKFITTRDKPYLFCGAHTGSAMASWCSHHRKIVWDPPKPKQKRIR